MSELYNHKVVEKKWQKVWDDNKAFAATDDYSKPKYYALVEFPYPSGQGLHVGHPRPYTALDIVARKRRMQGYNAALLAIVVGVVYLLPFPLPRFADPHYQYLKRHGLLDATGRPLPDEVINQILAQREGHPFS